MKKKNLLVSIILVGLLVSCNPSFEDDSQVDPSSQESSGEPSSSSGQDSSTPAHEHQKDDSVWLYNSTKHWHDCTAHDGYHFDEGDHTFTTVVVEPTYDTTGYTTYTCTVCGFSYTGDLTPKKEHQYESTWSYDEETHWHYCIDPGYEGLTKDEGEHTFNDNDPVIHAPTENDNGYTSIKCDTCDYEYQYDFVDPTGSHNYSNEWSNDETHHWHACLDDGCNAKSEFGNHTYGIPTLDPSTADITQNIKGTYTYTCTVCGYEKQETAYYTKEEMCDIANEYLNDKEYYDVFELRDDLASHNYSIYDTSEGTHFGYDLDNKKVALSDGNGIVYPNSGVSYDNFVPFLEEEVNSVATLKQAINSIASGNKQYSSIKLSNDINLEETIEITSKYPVEINLNNHTLDSLLDKGAAIKVDKSGTDKPIVSIVNGTIRTKVITGTDMTKSPSCVTLVQATSLRISHVYLINRAEKGYCYLDFPDYRYDAKVKIEYSNLSSTIVTIVIQTNSNIIDHNNITGVMVVNGGSSSITNNVVDATNVQEGLEGEAEEFVINQTLYSACYEYYVNRGHNTYMLTTTDAILIYDRRSTSGTYDNPIVSIHHNTLKCKLADDNATPLGYGVRYMDLQFDTSRTSNSLDLGLIEVSDVDNTFSYCTSASPLNAAGGMVFAEDWGN